MNTLEFIKSLRQLNIQLTVEGDRLRCNAPQGVMTSALKAELTARKAEIIAVFQNTKTAESSAIQSIPRVGTLPLSFAQQRLWFLDQLEGQSANYNIPHALRLSGALNVKALERSITEIIARHEVLRTTFPTIAGEPVQVVNAPESLILDIIDLQGLQEPELTREARRLARAAAHEPFDLGCDRPIRVKLLQMAPAVHILVVTMHHIVSDGWSMRIFSRELSVLYRDFSQGQSSSLEALPIQYADFAHWQQQWLSDTVLEQQLHYWQQQLYGLPSSLDLPTDRPRPAQQTYNGDRQILTLSPALTESLKALSQKTGATLYMLLLAAFQVLLFRQTWKTDIAVGTTIANRNRQDIENLIGFFANTLVIRTDLGGKPTFLELLDRVKQTTLDAYAHQDLPFEKLVEALKPERNLSYHPIIQIIFSWQNQVRKSLELTDLEVETFPLDSNVAKFDLGLNVIDRGDQLVAAFTYNTDLFEPATIERFAQQFQIILNTIVVQPEQTVTALARIKTSKKHFSCVLVGQGSLLMPCAETLLRHGHRIEQIVSSDRIVHDWSAERDINALTSSKDLVDVLDPKSFDYLFSILNLEILPPALLSLPVRGAINLHDALLPKYGGLYAPSWAIMHQEAEHGITWHWMTEGIDEGDILKQYPLSISATETAFTLNAKCYDAALQSFPQLIDDLLHDRISVNPQDLDQRSYFNAVQRPTPGCVVDWSWSADAIAALFRALDFGAYANPLGLPKLYVAGDFYVIKAIEISKYSTDVAPGTVVKIVADWLQIATASQDIIVRSLSTLESLPVELSTWAIQYQLQAGSLLPACPPELNQTITSTEAISLRWEALWAEQLAVLEPLNLPISAHSDATSRLQSQMLTLALSSVAQTLIAEAKWHPQDILSAAFFAYLARITQSNVFDLGFTVAWEFPETAPTAIFASVVPFRMEINYEDAFDSIISQVQLQIRRIQKHQTFYRDVVSRYPELSALCNSSIEQQLPVRLALPDRLSHYRPSSDLDFEFVIDQLGDCTFVYDAERYRTSDISGILRSFAAFLEHWLLNPDAQLKQLSLLSTADIAAVSQWQQPLLEYPQQRIDELFEAQVERTPQATALFDGSTNQTLTYQELNQQANQVAHYLRSHGVQAESLVGLCLERSTMMIVAILGILKAGGAYLPLDPTYPKQRLDLIVADAQPSLVLTNRRTQMACTITDIPHLCLDADRLAITQFPADNLKPINSLNDLAYVIYTSGSTGKPKGVMIEHGALTNFAIAAQQTYGLSEINSTQDKSPDRILQFASISFDAAAEEIYPCLISGSTLVLRNDDMLSSVEQFVKTCQTWQLTVLDLPTAYWQQLVLELAANRVVLPVSLRLVIIGGERVAPESIKTWQRMVGDAPQLINTYGPTEATVVATAYAIMSSTRIQNEVPIGQAITNVQTYVLDAYLQPVPIGVPGELYIGGSGLARGYLNRPDLTTERFIAHPFNQADGNRLYKTGDLVRYLPQGDLEFLGRIDQQVKIRGFRVELGEIEAALLQHPDIESVLVDTRTDASASQQLVAYVIARGEAPVTSELRNFLKVSLPEYMLPSAFVSLDRWPLTPSGKVDRRALSEIDLAQRAIDQAFIAPQTSIEIQLSQIWSELLQQEQVGVYDNFFELGGHSLLATQVVSRIRAAFSIELPLRTLFESPTIAALALVVKAQEMDDHLTPILPVLREADLPLSFAQQRLWFLDQLDHQSATYNVPKAFQLSGPLVIQAMEAAISEIVNRHEALRTNFQIIDSQPVQVITPAIPLTLEIIDLQSESELDQIAEVHRLAQAAAYEPFDLQTDRLIRVKLLKRSPESHVLLVTMHHIVSDGWSMGIFTHELSVLYRDFSTGNVASLPPLAIQYADFSHWQRAYLQGDVLERQLDYWQQQLADGPTCLELPIDAPRPAIQTFQGESVRFRLDAALTQKLKELSQTAGTTLFMTLLSAFAILLHRYTQADDIVIGSPIANRNRREIESLIGFFVNTLPLRTDLTGNPTFLTLLQRVSQMTLDAYAHQDLPFEKLVEELNPERNLSYHPLFQVMFVWQNALSKTLELPGIQLEALPVDWKIAKFDLTLSMSETDTELSGAFSYNCDLFKPATIERLVGHFQILLNAIVADPEQTISAFPLLTAAERQQQLFEWNATQTDYPRDACIHRLFEAQVEQRPHDIAIIFKQQQLTYRQLNTKANQLADHLQSFGVRTGSLIGLCVDRSIEMIVGLLAILKLGGVYVPIDPAAPRERFAFMLEDTKISLVLSAPGVLDQFVAEPFLNNIRHCDIDLAALNHNASANLKHHSKATDLAYVMYTSGSTGKPKGVSIPHRGVVRLVQETNYVAINANDVFLQLAPISFDAATLEIWGALLNGARLVLFPEAMPTPQTIRQVVADYQVTCLWLTAGLFHLMVDDSLEGLQSLRYLLAGGDVLSVSHVQRAVAQLDHCTVINGYGPTENTTFTCCYPISAAESITQSVPIGRPIANTQVYVLNAQRQPVPIGVAGELYVGGDGLAQAYFNRSSLTESQFIPHPFSDEPDARLYKTGDLVRYLPDGNLEFVGRFDHQVKIRGFRIELGEIEAALGQHPEVREAVVILREDVPNDQRLVAYFTTEYAGLTASKLAQFLKSLLPSYMLPAAFIRLAALPLTLNGKVDRRSLPVPDFTLGERDPQSVVIPQTLMEEMLARIWVDVLGIESLARNRTEIDIHANFFEMGGHSLSAVQIITQIRQVFQVELPLSTLFQASTIAGLAKLVAAEQQHGLGDRSTPWACLVPMQTGGTKPPVFLVPGGNHGERELITLTKLIYSLGPDQTVYGLRTQSVEGKGAPYESLEAMAADYVRELRQLQPQGPYQLLGECTGGLVALEMAQQLQLQGEVVGNLVLLDTAFPSQARSQSFREGRKISTQLRKYRRDIAQLKPRQIARHSLAQIKKATALFVSPKILDQQTQGYYAAIKHKENIFKYQPRPYTGQMTLLINRASYEHKPTLGWEALEGVELTVYPVSGDHDSYIGQHVKSTADVLKRCLAETQNNNA
ncbi:amino acid adenylation domain-containing protein [filamentous cyanobacterium LEGE 11480]|uniref:Amino acid adenylation domain-containing protein n=1 Tax=Romeriopsis navalis LEGE 11480 TaxID=2777977 RepID=A0A928Z375_9CYAN|nr:non-ribosomal peptide synthetase [Romeriopsis navalis]MBE9029045.1 amino acid adenylation domain-containing protein [Romeriopsis navalis LEGE 11480]